MSHHAIHKPGLRFLMLGLLATVSLLAVVMQSSFTLNRALSEERRAKTRQLVEVAHGVLEHYHGLEARHVLAPEEARRQALAALRALRYEGSEYFWVNDMTPAMVMHPFKPELEGKSVGELADPNGKHLFKEFVEVVRKDGAGYVDYLWPRPGSDQPVPKVSYVKGFAPWGWVVGSGIYVDDVSAAFWRQTAVSLALGVCALLVMMGGAWFVSQGVTRQVGGDPRYAMQIARRIAEGDLTGEVQLRANDTTSVLYHMHAMQRQLRAMLHKIHESTRSIGGQIGELARQGDGIQVASSLQAEAAQSASQALREMNGYLDEVSLSTRNVNDNSARTNALSSEGESLAQRASDSVAGISATVEETAHRIDALKQQTAQVASIAKVIREIAEQTNLLALNAAIEAARAGEQGRGFAVVADEVRKLAERTSDATGQISDMVHAVQAETDHAVLGIGEIVPCVASGVELSGRAASSLREIRESAGDTRERVQDVLSAIGALSSGSAGVVEIMQRITQMSASTDLAVKEGATVTTALAKSARGLDDAVACFKLA